MSTVEINVCESLIGFVPLFVTYMHIRKGEDGRRNEEGLPWEKNELFRFVYTCIYKKKEDIWDRNEEGLP